MKKILFKQSISGYGDPTRSGDKSFSFAPGDVAEIEANLATAWTESGIAEFISQSIPEPVAEYAVAKRGPGRPAKSAVVVPETVVETEVVPEPIAEAVVVEDVAVVEDSK